jgi:hypothetical protein
VTATADDLEEIESASAENTAQGERYPRKRSADDRPLKAL